MDKQSLISRIEEITKAIESSLAQHNALVGRLNEAQFILQKMEEFEQDVKDKNIIHMAEDAISIAKEVENLVHPEKKVSGDDSL